MNSEDNSISFDAINASSISSLAFDNHNKQEVKFMYGQLLKYTLTEMSYSNDDMDNMIKFFQEKCKNHNDIKIIKEFQENYSTTTPVWCYSNYTFLYTTLNLALRTCDFATLYAMGVFIKDLHQQIVKLHKTITDPKILKLYRGLVIPTSDFEEIKKTNGGLLSINNFLSTSLVKDVAKIFAAGAPNNYTSVLFEITIDQSMSIGVSYASIQKLSQFTNEEEYLFTMGSVFRIESVEQLDGNAEWCVHLTLTTDRDPELTQLTNYIQSQMQEPSLTNFCLLLLHMGEYEKVIEISETAIKTSNNISESGQFYYMLGFVYFNLGQCQQALDKFELVLDYCHRQSDSNELSLMTYMAKSFIFLQQGKFDLALTNIQAIMHNVHEYSNAEASHEILMICNQWMGIIFYRQGHFSDALSYQIKAYSMAKEYLPSTHPTIGECLDQLALTYMNVGQMDKALLCMEESMKIKQVSILPEHMSAVCSQQIYAVLRHLKGDRSMSGAHTQCLQTTFLKWQSDPKQNPMKLLLQARTYMMESKIDEALSTIDQYFSIQKENLSLEHHDFAFAYSIKGICHLRKKDLPEALQNLRQGYDIAIQHFGESHPMRLNILLSIAKVYAKQNNCDEVLIIVNQCKHLVSYDLENSIDYFGETNLKPIYLPFRIRGLEHLEYQEYEKALPVLQNCLKIQMNSLAHDHPDLADTYRHIAMSFDGMDNYSDALINYHKARVILENCLSPNDPMIAKIWERIGLGHISLQQYDDALFAYNKCLQIQINTLPSDHLELSDTYECIADALYCQNKSFAAIENYQRALDIRVKHLSSTDSKITKMWTMLGSIYFEVQQYHDGLLAFNKVLAIQSITLPSEHIDVAVTHKRIARVYYETGRYEEAVSSFQKCLDIQKTLLPPDHIDLAEIQTSIGNAFFKLNNFSDSLVNYQCAIHIQFKHLPATSLEIIENLKYLGVIYSEQRRFEDTLLAYHQSLEIQLKFLPSNYIDIAVSHKLIGLTYYATENYQEALQSFQKCLSIEMSSFPPNPIKITDTQSWIGDVFYKLNNFSDAVINYQRALDVQLQHLPATTLNVIKSWKNLGAVYSKLHQYDDSLSAYEQCLEIQLNILPSNHIDIAVTHKLIALRCCSMNQYSEALLNFQKCLHIQISSLSPNHPDLANTQSWINRLSRTRK